MAKRTLPADVAELYTCSVEPTIVRLPAPLNIVVDLTQVTLEEAELMAKNGHYLTKKAPKKALLS